MELVYLWVENYKNIQEQGFNFSPRFHCEFKAIYKKNENNIEVLDEDNSELIICDKKKKECKDNDYIENFFGDNINITAIVGKNGSGKSSVLAQLFITDKSDKKRTFTSSSKHLLLFNDKDNNKSINTNISSLGKKYKVNTVPYKEYKDDEALIKDYIRLIKDYKLYDSVNIKIDLKTYNYIPTEVSIGRKNDSKSSFEDIDEKVIDKITNLSLDDYDIDFRNEQGVEFERLSTGEKKWSYMFLKSYYDIETNESDKIIYAFDEPDNYLHPDWQKRFIFDLQNVFKDSKKEIHFILTTHSPFLLSDIPKQNIIFLDKDKDGKCIIVDGLKEKKQTFGANIHTLLSDSFFMEDGLMGEFAKGKINEIIDFHKKVEEEHSNKESLKKEYLDRQKKFWQTQSIVGDAYLQQVLENHLIEVEKILLGKDGAKVSKKERLLAQIKELDND